MIKDMRKFPRTEIDGRVKISFVTFEKDENGEIKEDVKIIDVHVRDISLGGIGFVHSDFFLIDTRCYLFLTIERKRYGLFGKISRCDRRTFGHHIGIELMQQMNDEGVYEPMDEVKEVIEKLKNNLEKAVN